MSVIGEAMEEKIYELNKQIKALQDSNDKLRVENLDLDLQVTWLKEQNKLLEQQIQDLRDIIIKAENDRVRSLWKMEED